MRRTARRAPAAPRLEVLEPRRLLDTGAGAAPPNSSESLLVRFAPGVDPATTRAILDPLGAHVLGSYPDGPRWVALGPGVDPVAASRRLAAGPRVAYAEPDATFHVAATVPNDPLFAQQWGLHSGNDVDIDAPQAWD